MSDRPSQVLKAEDMAFLNGDGSTIHEEPIRTKNQTQSTSAMVEAPQVIDGDDERELQHASNSMMVSNSKHRVRVFLRSSSNIDWNEIGTGNLILGVEEKETKKGPSSSEVKSLHVINEVDGRNILQTQIENIVNQDKQDETIIIWAEDDRECALSFQEKNDCDEVFKYIQAVKKFDASSDCLQSSDNLFELPKCSVDTLELLANSLEQAANCPENYERIIEDGDYLPNTLNLISLCLNSDSIECRSAMKFLSRICIALICFNKQHILDVLLSKENIMTTIEALQFDPSNGEKSFDHKYYLENKASLKHMIEATKDEMIKEKIELTFLMQYIVDNFFPINNSVEKARINALYSSITLNNLFIVDHIIQEKNDIKSLIEKMKFSESIPSDELRKFSLDIIFFFKELCMCVQALDRKESFLKILTELGFLDSLYILIKREYEIWNQVFIDVQNNLTNNKSGLEVQSCSQALNAIIEILSMFVLSCPSDFHKFVVKNRFQNADDESKDIFEYLIDICHGSLFQYIKGSHEHMKILPVSFERLPDITSSIRLFSDILEISNTMETETISSHLHLFKNDFYNYYALTLFSPLFINEKTNVNQFTSWHGYLQSRLMQFLLLLLSQPENFNSCYNFLKKTNFLEKIDHLCSSNFQSIYTDIILLIMRLIFSNDAFVQLHIMRLPIFTKIFTEIFPLFKSSHNMITGTISHFLDRARLEDSITLRQFIVEKFDHIFQDFDLTQSFKELKELTLHHLEISKNMKSFGSDILSDNSSSNSMMASKINKVDDEWLEDDYADELNNQDDDANKNNHINTDLNDQYISDPNTKNRLDKEYDKIFSDLDFKKKIALAKDPQNMPGYYSPRPSNIAPKKPISIRLKTNQTTNDEEAEVDSLCDGLDLQYANKPAPKSAKLNSHDDNEKDNQNEEISQDTFQNNFLVNYSSSSSDNDDLNTNDDNKKSQNNNINSSNNSVKEKLSFKEESDDD